MQGADIVWHNSQSNETQIWFMNAGGDGIKRRATVLDENGQKIFVGPPWSIVGASQGEIVWHNSQSDETQIWFMNAGGDGIKRRATVVDENGQKIFVGPPWSIVGASQAEIVWHNSQSDETQIWFMNAGGDGIKRRATVVDENGQKTFVGLPWSIVGVSQGEIVWHNSQSSETQIWFITDGPGIDPVSLEPAEGNLRFRATVVDENGQRISVGPPWGVVGSNQGEIVWHNRQSNETQIWFMNGGGGGIRRRATVVDEDGQKILVGPPWSIVAVSAPVAPAFAPKPPIKEPARPDNPEFGDPTGAGKDKPDPPNDPPPEDGATKNNPLKPEGPQFTDGPPATETGCFSGSTQVLMSDGLTKAIDAIVAGDHVMARDEQTGITNAGTVSRIYRHRVAETLLLQMDGGEVVETTSAHRFAAEEGGFVSAGQLRPGDRLSTYDKKSAGVVSTEARLDDVTVYNLSVDRFHTYFISNARIWVHNVKDADV